MATNTRTSGSPTLQPRPSPQKFLATAAVASAVRALNQASALDTTKGPIDFVYILSASHSGSTLLTMLMASHPEIATVGETSAVLAVGDRDVGLCSCGASVADCSFWQAIRKDMLSRGVDVQKADFRVAHRLPEVPWVDRVLRAEFRGPLLESLRDFLLALSPRWSAQSQRIDLANRSLIEAVVARRNTRHFVDSSKEPHRLKFMRCIDGLNARVIHLMRDGRGVAASYMKKNQMSISDAVNEWVRSVCSQEAILKTFDERDVIHLRYEDLCTDPAGNLARIFQFMGIDATHDASNYHKSEHHVLGNRMRLSGSAEIRLDEKWRTALSVTDLKTFGSIAGAINKRYGYE